MNGITDTRTPSTQPGDTVWVFHPDGAACSFPTGLWSSRDNAREWIDRVNAQGSLSEYELDEFAYDSTRGGTTVWVFHLAGASGTFVSSVWSTQNKAHEWIRHVDARGTLSAYILDESAYDSNVRMGLLKTEGKPERCTPEFIRGYSTAIDHEHFTGTQAYAVPLGRDTATRAQMIDPSTGKTRYQCLCCGAYTLSKVDQCDICEECGWEDCDECHDAPGETIRPNYISLNLARSLVERFGPAAAAESNYSHGGVERARAIEAMTAEERAKLKTARQQVQGK